MSEHFPSMVSLRVRGGPDRQLLLRRLQPFVTRAGFVPGERVVLICRDDLDELERRACMRPLARLWARITGPFRGVLR